MTCVRHTDESGSPQFADFAVAWTPTALACPGPVATPHPSAPVNRTARRDRRPAARRTRPRPLRSAPAAAARAFHRDGVAVSSRPRHLTDEGHLGRGPGDRAAVPHVDRGSRARHHGAGRSPRRAEARTRHGVVGARRGGRVGRRVRRRGDRAPRDGVRRARHRPGRQPHGRPRRQPRGRPGPQLRERLRRRLRQRLRHEGVRLRPGRRRLHRRGRRGPVRRRSRSSHPDGPTVRRVAHRRGLPRDGPGLWELPRRRAGLHRRRAELPRAVRAVGRSDLRTVGTRLHVLLPERGLLGVRRSTHLLHRRPARRGHGHARGQRDDDGLHAARRPRA